MGKIRIPQWAVSKVGTRGGSPYPPTGVDEGDAGARGAGYTTGRECSRHYPLEIPEGAFQAGYVLSRGCHMNTYWPSLR